MAVGVVVGLLAGLYELVTAVARRRRRKIEDEVFDAIADAVDTTALKHDSARLRLIRQTLRREVEEEVPLEARRVYLRSRLDALRTTIGSELEEFERLRAELGRLEEVRPAPLDARLRPVVENSIRPEYVRRRRNERLVVAILLLLLVASIAPLALSSLVDQAWSDYAHSINGPGSYPADDLGSSLILGALAICGALSRRARRLTGSVSGERLAAKTPP